MKAGTRVGAICSADDSSVRFYGYGTYVGDEVPPPEIQFFGGPLNRPNPKIVLDDGKVVWGCECWWGSEQRVKDSIGSKTVEPVDIEVRRAENSAGERHE